MISRALELKSAVMPLMGRQMRAQAYCHGKKTSRAIAIRGARTRKRVVVGIVRSRGVSLSISQGILDRGHGHVPRRPTCLQRAAREPQPGLCSGGWSRYSIESHVLQLHYRYSCAFLKV